MKHKNSKSKKVQVTEDHFPEDPLFICELFKRDANGVYCYTDVKDEPTDKLIIGGFVKKDGNIKLVACCQGDTKTKLATPDPDDPSKTLMPADIIDISFKAGDVCAAQNHEEMQKKEVKCNEKEFVVKYCSNNTKAKVQVTKGYKGKFSSECLRGGIPGTYKNEPVKKTETPQANRGAPSEKSDNGNPPGDKPPGNPPPEDKPPGNPPPEDKPPGGQGTKVPEDSDDVGDLNSKFEDDYDDKVRDLPQYDEKDIDDETKQSNVDEFSSELQGLKLYELFHSLLRRQIIKTVAYNIKNYNNQKELIDAARVEDKFIKKQFVGENKTAILKEDIGFDKTKTLALCEGQSKWLKKEYEKVMKYACMWISDQQQNEHKKLENLDRNTQKGQLKWQANNNKIGKDFYKEITYNGIKDKWFILKDKIKSSEFLGAFNESKDKKYEFSKRKDDNGNILYQKDGRDVNLWRKLENVVEINPFEKQF